MYVCVYVYINNIWQISQSQNLIQWAWIQIYLFSYNYVRPYVNKQHMTRTRYRAYNPPQKLSTLCAILKTRTLYMHILSYMFRNLCYNTIQSALHAYPCKRRIQWGGAVTAIFTQAQLCGVECPKKKPFVGQISALAYTISMKYVDFVI